MKKLIIVLTIIACITNIQAATPGHVLAPKNHTKFEQLNYNGSNTCEVYWKVGTSWAWDMSQPWAYIWHQWVVPSQCYTMEGSPFTEYIVYYTPGSTTAPWNEWIYKKNLGQPQLLCTNCATVPVEIVIGNEQCHFTNVAGTLPPPKTYTRSVSSKYRLQLTGYPWLAFNVPIIAQAQSIIDDFGCELNGGTNIFATDIYINGTQCQATGDAWTGFVNFVIYADSSWTDLEVTTPAYHNMHYTIQLGTITEH